MRGQGRWCLLCPMYPAAYVADADAISLQMQDGSTYFALQNRKVSVLSPDTVIGIGTGPDVDPAMFEQAVADAIVLQMKDGTTYFALKQDRVSVVSPSTVMALGTAQGHSWSRGSYAGKG